jgi:hypothetical protein
MLRGKSWGAEAGNTLSATWKLMKAVADRRGSGLFARYCPVIETA